MDTQLAASWVSAVGSAGSLLGFAAYVLIMLLNRKDQVEVRQEQQAQGVAAWLCERSDPGPDDGRVLLSVHNGGETPVFNVHCLFSLPTEDEQHSVALALIPPDTTVRRGMPFDSANLSDDEFAATPAVPEMRFTDSHGTSWQRDGQGRLRRLERRTLRRRPRRDTGGTGDGGDGARDDARWERDHRDRTTSARERSGPRSHP